MFSTIELVEIVASLVLRPFLVNVVADVLFRLAGPVSGFIGLSSPGLAISCLRFKSLLKVVVGKHQSTFSRFPHLLEVF